MICQIRPGTKRKERSKTIYQLLICLLILISHTRLWSQSNCGCKSL